MATATFAEHEHRYEVDGEVIPSVTQVLTLAGISDVSGIPAYILERAREIGTQVHTATELLDQDDLDLDSLDQQIVGYVTAYQRFKSEHEFSPDFIEHRGVGEWKGLRFGYCIDRIGHCTRNDSRFEVLLDLKTSSRPQASWAIQTAAYQEGIQAFPERLIVHVAKDGTYKLISHTDIVEDIEVWHAALRVAHWKLSHGTKLKEK